MATSSTPSSQSAFYQAHHFVVETATFINQSGYGRRLEDLKVDLWKTVIRGATYSELPVRRHDMLMHLEIPQDVEKWIQNPRTYFITNRFLKSRSKDILSTTGIPILRYFLSNNTPGITLVAHILFYDVPFVEGRPISKRPDVSHCWVTTLAYQLMLSIPDLAIPMLSALHMDPGIPKYRSEIQIKKLIMQPLQSVLSEGLLSTDETKLILLDCIDCSTDAPAVANVIAFLIKELQSLNGQPLKLIITGSPDYDVLNTFTNIPIEVSDLSHPRRTGATSRRRYRRWNKSHNCITPILTMFLWVAALEGFFCLVFGIETWPIFAAIFIILTGFFLLVAILAIIIVFPVYVYVKYSRPWDVHGREVFFEMLFAQPREESRPLLH